MPPLLLLVPGRVLVAPVISARDGLGLVAALRASNELLHRRRTRATVPSVVLLGLLLVPGTLGAIGNLAVDLSLGQAAAFAAFASAVTVPLAAALLVSFTD